MSFDSYLVVSILQTQCLSKGCDVYSDYSNFASNEDRQWTAINLGLGTC